MAASEPRTPEHGAGSFARGSNRKVASSPTRRALRECFGCVHATAISTVAERLNLARAEPKITDRVASGVVYTILHHPKTQADVVTPDCSDWATNWPQYRVTALQVTPSNRPSEWQQELQELTQRSRRIEAVPAK